MPNVPEILEPTLKEIREIREEVEGAASAVTESEESAQAAKEAEEAAILEAAVATEKAKEVEEGGYAVAKETVEEEFGPESVTTEKLVEEAVIPRKTAPGEWVPLLLEETVETGTENNEAAMRVDGANTVRLRGYIKVKEGEEVEAGKNLAAIPPILRNKPLEATMQFLVPRTIIGVENPVVSLGVSTAGIIETNTLLTEEQVVFFDGITWDAGELTAPINIGEEGLPSITGTVKVGKTLTAQSGEWTQEPTSFTYDWQYKPPGGEEWTSFTEPPHTEETFVIPSELPQAGELGEKESSVGWSLRIKVKAKNAAGTGSASSFGVEIKA